MKRGGPAKLILRALEVYGPMTDGQLAWWLRARFKVSEATTRRARRLLALRGLLGSGGARINARGQAVRKWQIMPDPLRKARAAEKLRMETTKPAEPEASR